MEVLSGPMPILPNPVLEILKIPALCVSAETESHTAQLSTKLQITELYIVAFTLTFIVIVMCLAESSAFCCAGLSRSKSSNLVVRQSGSAGYRVETVCVEKLQNIWHPLKWGDNDEVRTAPGYCSSSLGSYRYL